MTDERRRKHKWNGPAVRTVTGKLRVTCVYCEKAYGTPSPCPKAPAPEPTEVERLRTLLANTRDVLAGYAVGCRDDGCPCISCDGGETALEAVTAIDASGLVPRPSTKPGKQNNSERCEKGD